VQPKPQKKLTPVMRQHEEAKAAHPDAILFFRMGDFYEMFGDDAVVCSRALDLALTSRNKEDPTEQPMAGVPYHAAHGYIAKLLAMGHKVAICEQMADPSKCKGIVPRQVVRVITPGLVTDTDQLDARTNHWLLAVDQDELSRTEFSIALLDLSTGELAAGTMSDIASILAELARCDPRELLWGAELDSVIRTGISLSAPRAVLREDEPLADADVASVIDGAVAEPIAAEAAGRIPRGALRAAARLLRFARKCMPGGNLPVRRIALHESSSTMRIDETAQLHLEILRGVEGSRKGTLLDTVDSTVTPAGARLLRRRLVAPLLDVATIRRRLDEVEAFVNNPRARTELREALERVGDIERLSVRAVLKEATPRDLGALRTGLLAAPAAIAAARSIAGSDADELFGGEIDPVADVAGRLEAVLV
jgi:DNA mismatch repair protein MutS